MEFISVSVGTVIKVQQAIGKEITHYLFEGLTKCMGNKTQRNGQMEKQQVLLLNIKHQNMHLTLYGVRNHIW